MCLLLFWCCVLIVRKLLLGTCIARPPKGEWGAQNSHHLFPNPHTLWSYNSNLLLSRRTCGFPCCLSLAACQKSIFFYGKVLNLSSAVLYTLQTSCPKSYVGTVLCVFSFLPFVCQVVISKRVFEPLSCRDASSKGCCWVGLMK